MEGDLLPLLGRLAPTVAESVSKAPTALATRLLTADAGATDIPDT